jgi:hypothetical protein
MAPQSEFEWGCFAPCKCPVFVQQQVEGTFKLTKTGSDPLFDHYAVNDVRWKVPDGARSLSVVGSGTYRRGGEVAIQEQLVLDLSVDGGVPQHFDSGLVPPQAPFPAIHTTISLHGEYCFDTAFVVVAKPIGVASVDVGTGVEFLTVNPSPFRTSTDVAFSLLRGRRIDLEVFDVTGRQVGFLARGEWLAAGEHTRRWEGRLPTGNAAPPGLYFIRLATLDGSLVRTVVRLD